MDKQSIGFIGLGNMGLPMAKNLLNAGHTLTVYDQNPQAVEMMVSLGAHTGHSARDVASKSQVVFTSLPNSAIMESVVLSEEGILAGLAAGSALIDMSSSEPSSTRKLAHMLTEKNIAMLDAPVSGGPEGAAEGKLSIMVGGEEADFQKYLPLLEHLGEKIYYVGAIGSGHALKSINNLLYGAIFVASCEAISLGVKAGIDAEKLLEVISASAGRNFAVDVKFKNNVLPRDFNPGFSTDLLHKDMDIAISLAKEQKVPLLVCDIAQQMITVGQQKGFGQLDHTAMIKMYEEVLGIEVK